ncbi:SDR family oxidoreductase [Sphingosinicella rhizophila]|uniref:SDR family oxidoreductase n=1 Tax=Sphingosinicella rhizophila TaxID=3050082 RepID=A0ABU3QBL9_9SPHN|nr:SDR family oxidoreductase [Sphingosinicella sp. GR2756]MDT9600544.1 SDR family oxidoreductase [Sphingosinicella sp. GR2756]
MSSNGLDLGIAGKTALVCGSTMGLGNACASALAAAGAQVVVNGRTAKTVDAAVKALEDRFGRPFKGVAADVTTSEGRSILLAACPDPDILVTNAAGPPPGRFEDWDETAWEAALAANMVAPIMLIRQILGPMRRRRWGRILNITSGAVKAPLPMLGLSNGARSGLTGFVAGLAREVARDGVTINNLLPGNFATDRLHRYVAALAGARGMSSQDIWAEMESANPSGRIGVPEEFGAACAFFTSQHAGFITGQNLLLDGGAYPGTF